MNLLKNLYWGFYWSNRSFQAWQSILPLDEQTEKETLDVYKDYLYMTLNLLQKNDFPDLKKTK